MGRPEISTPVLVHQVVYKLTWGLCLLGWTTSVLSCNPGHHYHNSYRFSSGLVDYNHLDNLDASRHPTLSDKIRVVVRDHYGWDRKPQTNYGSGYRNFGYGAGNGGHYQYASHNHLSPVIMGVSSNDYILKRLHGRFLKDGGMLNKH